MADFTALKTAIQTYIKQNGNEEITGAILQEILLSVVTTLGDGAINDLITALGNEVTARQQADGTLQQNITNEATARGNADTALQGLINGVKNNVDNGYVYVGIATPSSTPVTGKVFYLALTAGTYTNFGSTEVSQGINILKYNGSAWSLDAFIGIDDTPTPNSPKLVKSGGTFDSIMTDGSAFDISAHFASGGTLATYADLSAALTALNTLSESYKRGGMSIKFVQSSDNKYVQHMLTTQSFTTKEQCWQKMGTRDIESKEAFDLLSNWSLNITTEAGAYNGTTGEPDDRPEIQAAWQRCKIKNLYPSFIGHSIKFSVMPNVIVEYLNDGTINTISPNTSSIYIVSINVTSIGLDFSATSTIDLTFYVPNDYSIRGAFFETEQKIKDSEHYSGKEIATLGNLEDNIFVDSLISTGNNEWVRHNSGNTFKSGDVVRIIVQAKEPTFATKPDGDYFTLIATQGTTLEQPLIIFKQFTVNDDWQDIDMYYTLPDGYNTIWVSSAMDDGCMTMTYIKKEELIAADNIISVENDTWLRKSYSLNGASKVHIKATSINPSFIHKLDGDYFSIIATQGNTFDRYNVLLSYQIPNAWQDIDADFMIPEWADTIWVSSAMDKDSEVSYIIADATNISKQLRGATPKFLGLTHSFATSLSREQDRQLYWGIGTKDIAKFGDCKAGITTSSICNAIRPITYEDGQVIYENGFIYVLTSSATTYCGSLVWKLNVNSYEMELVGNIIYKCDSHYYNHYPTASFMYDRNLHLWICTLDYFGGDSYLYQGSSIEDIRFGKHIIETSRINLEDATVNDEDSFLYYDNDTNSPLYQKYVLMFTRMINDTFKLCIASSDTWNGRFNTYAINTDTETSETGATVQKVGGTPYIFIGGRYGDNPANDKYRVLAYPSMEKLGYLNLDKPTGGWGGWCCMFAVPSSDKTKYMFITFDRGTTSSVDEWTYGTTYIYEAEERNPGCEYPVKMLDGAVKPADITASYTPLQMHFKRVYQKTHYFDSWLDYSGFFPRYEVNRQYSNELPLTNATLSNVNNAIVLESDTEGFGNIAPYVPMSEAYKLRIYNIDGIAEFFIANSDYSQYRKILFEISASKCDIKTVDNFADISNPTEYDEMSFAFTGDYVDVIIGVNGFYNKNNFSIVIVQ